MTTKRYASAGLIFALIFSGLTILIPSVSATAGNTWIADTPQSASNAAYWENGTLATGQNIWFIDAHDGNCAWNVVDSFGDYHITTGYAGTITQGASFSVTSYSQAAGTFTGSNSYTLTDSGNFIRTAGILSDDILKLTMTGSDKIYNTATVNILKTFNLNDDTTIAQTVYAKFLSNTATTTINSGKSIIWVTFTGATYSNTGTLQGLGTFAIEQMTYIPITIGTMNCPLSIAAYGGSVANQIFTLSGAMILSSTLTIFSYHATYTMMVDTSASNYALSATSITIGTRGILNARASQITASGNWDSSAGTFTKGTSIIHLTGTSKTLKTAGTGFNNLVIESGATIQLLSNVTTEYLWNNGTLGLNGFTMTVNHDQAPSITSSTVVLCHFIDDYYYNITATDQEKETLTYGLTTTWPNVAINSTTGKITNVATLTNGTWLMNVSVTDGNHTVYQSFNLNIWNYAPVFTTSARYQVMVLDNYFYFANATDSEGYTIIYNCTITVTWLVWNPTNHSLSGIPFDRDIGYYDVSISAWDGYETTYQNFTIQIMGALTTKMATFIIYFIFQIVLIAFGLIGYFKIPFLLFVEIIGTMLIAFQTVDGFDAYWTIAIILIVTNITIPIMGLSKIRR